VISKEVKTFVPITSKNSASGLGTYIQAGSEREYLLQSAVENCREVQRGQGSTVI